MALSESCPGQPLRLTVDARESDPWSGDRWNRERSNVFFEPAIWNSGENIAVYLYGYFGILGLILLIFYAWKASRTATSTPIGRFIFYSACAVLLEGATMSVLEASLFLPLAFGASLWYVQKAAVRTRYRVLADGKRAMGPASTGTSQPDFT